MAIWKGNSLIRAVYKNGEIVKGIYRGDTLVWPSSYASYLMAIQGTDCSPSVVGDLVQVVPGTSYYTPTMYQKKFSLKNDPSKVEWTLHNSDGKYWYSLKNLDTSPATIITVNWHMQAKDSLGSDVKYIALLKGYTTYAVVQTMGVTVNTSYYGSSGAFNPITLNPGESIVPISFILDSSNWGTTSTIKDIAIQVISSGK